MFAPVLESPPASSRDSGPPAGNDWGLLAFVFMSGRLRENDVLFNHIKLQPVSDKVSPQAVRY